MSGLLDILTSPDPAIRNRSLDAFCRGASLPQLLEECNKLDTFRRHSENLYERVRALFFLYAIHRFHLPGRVADASAGIPHQGYLDLLNRRFEEAIERFLTAQAAQGSSAAMSSALAAAYRALGFQTLTDQVRRSVRSVRGNQWMFRIGHPADHPLRIRPELKTKVQGLFPILHESTPVRMDLTHSAWSDIFFLGMDFPEGARVLNISVDLSLRGRSPKPPVEAFLRVIDGPVLRLTSVDLNTTADVRSIAEVFDFSRDYLGLLKAAIIAAGLMPPGMEGAQQPLEDVLRILTGLPGHGLEIVSKVNDIPKGSRLAVSTNLLACLISACMRATSQIDALTGPLPEEDRRLIAARAILGEWLGGSGGGWQDSGGVWPGIKLIRGVLAGPNDPEYGISRGRLLPQHEVLGAGQLAPDVKERLQNSLVLVHGGMAQDIGPILEMVTERYLLRSESEWAGRQEAIRLLDQILEQLASGDLQGIGASTQRNFDGPIQTVIPWAANLFTQTVIDRVRAESGDAFYGFLMLGGMSGGGMGFLFSPDQHAAAPDRMQRILLESKRHLERAMPFAIDPVVYDFAINEQGTNAALHAGDTAVMPVAYYLLTMPPLLRADARSLSPLRRADMQRFASACRQVPEFSTAVEGLFERVLPHADSDAARDSEDLHALLDRYGFDRTEHEQIQANLRTGRLGLMQNRLPVSTTIQDVERDDVFDARTKVSEELRRVGEKALSNGEVAVVSLAGGIGSRWTRGAGVVKALNPFWRVAGRHRTFIEVHFAKSRKVSEQCGAALPHIITTSYLTHEAIRSFLEAESNYHYPGEALLSFGNSIGLRMIPMERDLRFAWEEMSEQVLDEQRQKVRESLHASLIGWARQMGEGSDYTANVPRQCLHPVGHWYEVPNLLRSGVLASLLAARPQLRYLMVHNIDTVGADVDAAILGEHIQSGAGMTTEVIARHITDRGGGLARIDGRLRLIEGLALPNEEIESKLSFYNTATTWIDIDKLLQVFGLRREDLENKTQVSDAVRAIAARMPTYITIKDVKKRWGEGQEDVYPVSQFEKLWGDMTNIAELDCRFIAVRRERGQQLKEPAQLDGWLRDGSAAYVEQLCVF